MITANKYFSHWIKKIDIKRYGDDLQILPVGNSSDVYQYSNIKAYFHVKLHAKRCVRNFRKNFPVCERRCRSFEWSKSSNGI